MRDPRGNFWLYLDHAPYALLKYDPGFHYQFALLLPGPALAFDTDGDGNVWILHPGNWLSKHTPLGQTLGAWDLPFGREPGEFSLASGLVIDRDHGFLYLADEVLCRVQRFDLNLQAPAHSRPSAGDGSAAKTSATPASASTIPKPPTTCLDRPRDLRLDGAGHLYVASEHYLSKFDLGSGKQLPFGNSPVLGWGGSFTDSAFSPSAATNGHWQRLYLAGVDRTGRLYVADRDNEFVRTQRLQVFSPDGQFEQVFSFDKPVKDISGAPAYLGAVARLALDGDRVWLADAAGRVYASQRGLQGGGKLYLGPGAAGRQFDLSQVEEAKFAVEAQTARAQHTTSGKVLAFAGDQETTRNCERDGITTLKNGERSLWLPVRLGEPFTVQFFDAQKQPLPDTDYRLDFEETPGLFGTRYDFFRVTNKSGKDWTAITFTATTK